MTTADSEEPAATGDQQAASPVVIITGASSGIGEATAKRLAADGTTVVLAARRRDRLASVADACRTAGAEAVTVPTDVTDVDAVEALVATTTERFGRLDGVVANAGIGERRDVPIEALPLEQFEAVTTTNVHGAFYTARAAMPALRDHDGTIVFVGSYKGKYPSASSPVYAASKWWLRGFAMSLAGQAGPDDVGVSLVNPTGVRTEFGTAFREESNATALEADATVSATEVADAIAYALNQEPPTMTAEIDVFRRDIHERF